jgi:hypothetical protein
MSSLFVLDSVNKGAFSHHVIAPHHPSSQSETQDNFRIYKECKCWNCQVHDETMDAARMVQYNAYNAAKL